MTMGIRIKEERERFKLSQTAFGEIGGVLRNAQINYEKGERVPDGNYFAAVAKIGVDVYYILTGERKQPPAEVLEDEEKTLLNAYRALPDKGKKEILLAILSGDIGGKQKRKSSIKAKGDKNIILSGTVKGGIHNN